MKKTMKLALLWAMAAMAAVTFTACDDKGGGDEIPEYNVKAEYSQYGMVGVQAPGDEQSFSETTAIEGATLTLSVENISEEYLFTGWTVVGGGPLTLSPDAKTNPATFRMPARDVVVKAEFAERQLTPADPAQLDQTGFADEEQKMVNFVAKSAWTASVADATTTRASAVSWLRLFLGGEETYSGGAGSIDLVIELDVNTTGADRSATITIESDGQRMTITVTQKGKTESGEVPEPPKYNTITIDGLDVEMDGGTMKYYGNNRVFVGLLPTEYPDDDWEWDATDYWAEFEVAIPDGTDRLVAGTYTITTGAAVVDSKQAQVAMTGGTVKVAVSGTGDDAVYTIEMDCTLSGGGKVTGTYRNTLEWWDVVAEGLLTAHPWKFVYLLDVDITGPYAGEIAAEYTDIDATITFKADGTITAVGPDQDIFTRRFGLTPTYRLSDDGRTLTIYVTHSDGESFSGDLDVVKLTDTEFEFGGTFTGDGEDSSGSTYTYDYVVTFKFVK